MNTSEFSKNCWNIVVFLDDNSVEVVPDIWIKKKSCAWPKSKNDVRKFVQKRIKPNSKDFFSIKPEF